MGLSDDQVRATIAVSDIDSAREFYEGKLGLSAMEGGPDEIRIYRCGGDTLLQVYASEHAGTAAGTAASWSVSDFDGVIEELRSKGVEFERYDAPESGEDGVHTYGEHRVVWFKDPTGNTIAVDNGGSV